MDHVKVTAPALGLTRRSHKFWQSYPRCQRIFRLLTGYELIQSKDTGWCLEMGIEIDTLTHNRGHRADVLKKMSARSKSEVLGVKRERYAVGRGGGDCSMSCAGMSATTRSSCWGASDAQEERRRAKGVKAEVSGSGSRGAQNDLAGGRAAVREAPPGGRAAVVARITSASTVPFRARCGGGRWK
jgi:hypothetical protein